MKLRLEDKKKAISLRIEGKTYKEIMSIIPNLPKSTLSCWLRNVKLTKSQEKILAKNVKKIDYNARAKASWTRRQRNLARSKRIASLAKKESKKLLKNPLFLAGVVFYWAEGARKNASYFSFSNSDPDVIKIMMDWLVKFNKIPKDKIKIRLFIHKIYALENCEGYWSKITGIPASHFLKTIYKPTPHKIKKNINYKGCVQIRVYNADFFKKMKGWKDGVVDLLNIK